MRTPCPIDALSTVVEFRSLETGEHIKRIKYFTRVLLKYLVAHRLAGYQYHRNFFKNIMLLHVIQHSEAVHHRHHDIQ